MKDGQEKKQYSMNPNAVTFQSMYSQPPSSAAQSNDYTQQQQQQSQQQQSHTSSSSVDNNKYNEYQGESGCHIFAHIMIFSTILKQNIFTLITSEFLLFSGKNLP